MSTKTKSVHDAINDLKDAVFSQEQEIDQLESKVESLESDIFIMQNRIDSNLDDACDALFVNDRSNAPGKLVIIDYWGNEIGEWTPETLREFMKSCLL